MNINNPDHLHEKAAANYLSVSLSTLKRIRYSGDIGHYRIGMRIRYSKSQHLDPFISSCEIQVNEVEGENQLSH